MSNEFDDELDYNDELDEGYEDEHKNGYNYNYDENDYSYDDGDEDSDEDSYDSY